MLVVAIGDASKADLQVPVEEVGERLLWWGRAVLTAGPRCPSYARRERLHWNTVKMTPFRTADTGPVVARWDYPSSAPYQRRRIAHLNNLYIILCNLCSVIFYHHHCHRQP